MTKPFVSLVKNTMNRTTIQIKTGEFEYIMQEVEVESPEAAVEAYKALKRAYEGGGVGLSAKDFNAALDEFMKSGNLVGGTELYAQMNGTQKGIMQELKKAFKRISYNKEIE